MAIHHKREDAKPGTRLLLESKDPVELPKAEVNEDGVTIEREEFRPHLPELLELLRGGVLARPAPVVMSDSMFVIDGRTRSFWLRIWHIDRERARIDRLHLSSCIPIIPGLRLPDLKNPR